MAEPDSSEYEMIAADLTLYQNPLNNALTACKVSSMIESRNKEEASKSDKSTKTAGSKPAVSEPPPRDQAKEEEWIASDMTKYDSPLAELDTQRQLRKMEEATGAAK